MSNDRELQKIADLIAEAYRAGLLKKSADIAQRGAELARIRGNTDSRVFFLLWHGISLLGLGEKGPAQISLLQAASPVAEADPANQYSALTSLISIAMAQHEASYCRRLIAQGHEYLRAIHKEAWCHKLNYLEGELEAARGAFELAQRHFERAWESLPPDAYPAYTTATYASSLVTNAFALRDFATLSRWQTELDSCEKSIEHDKLLKGSGRLLLLRARRDEAGLTEAIPAALELLRHFQDVEGCGGDPNESNRNSIYTLALAGHWIAVDDWMPRLHWDAANFNDQLFLLNERLCRARYLLELPPRDDEWDLELEELCPPHVQNRELRGREHAAKVLREAHHYHEAAVAIAATEDLRLETTWHMDTLKQRLARISVLESTLT